MLFGIFVEHFLRMKQISVLFLACMGLLSHTANAQSKGSYTVNGFVTDSQTGEKLISAYVFDQVSQQGTTTNAYGFFSMTLPKDSVALQVSFIGYQPYLKGSFLNKRSVTEMDVMLVPDDILLEEVEVVGVRAGEVQERTQMSSVNLDIKTVKNLPVLAWRDGFAQSDPTASGRSEWDGRDIGLSTCAAEDRTKTSSSSMAYPFTTFPTSLAFSRSSMQMRSTMSSSSRAVFPRNMAVGCPPFWMSE